VSTEDCEIERLRACEEEEAEAGGGGVDGSDKSDKGDGASMGVGEVTIGAEMIRGVRVEGETLRLVRVLDLGIGAEDSSATGSASGALS